MALVDRVIIVGCGDIGLRVARLELAAGRPVFGLARSAESASRLAAEGIGPLGGDLDVADSLLGLAEPGVTLYYLAPPPASGSGDPRLAAWLEATGDAKRPRSLVYVSTSGVYGDCGGRWIDESEPLRPQTDRAKRRVAAETLLNDWSARVREVVTILRVPGIYGPGRLPIERLRAGRRVVREDESSYSNRIHADDLAQACFLAAHGEHEGRVYNVSDGHPTTMSDYFNRVADVVGLPRPPQVSMGEARRTFDPVSLSFLEESKRLDNRRMLNDLGVRLRYPTLVEGLTASLSS